MHKNAMLVSTRYQSHSKAYYLRGAGAKHHCSSRPTKVAKEFTFGCLEEILWTVRVVGSIPLKTRHHHQRPRGGRLERSLCC